MRILAVDTSSKSASAAVLDNGVLLCESTINTNLTHSQTIMPLISSMMKNAMLSLSDVDVFAAAEGPGSFTGLRIGLSGVKAMAQAGGKPCVAISTLEALAFNLCDINAIICSVLDARCNQVYMALFDNRDGNFTRLCDDNAVLIEDLSHILKNYNSPIFFVGDGATLCYNKLKDENLDLRVASSALVNLRASSICKLAEIKGEQAHIKADMLLPKYLKLPQAQRELMAKQKSEGN